MQNDKEKTDTKKGDEVLNRMLRTPPNLKLPPKPVKDDDYDGS